MATYKVPTEGGGYTRVTLDGPEPKDQAALDAAIDAKLAAGEHQPISGEVKAPKSTAQKVVRGALLPTVGTAIGATVGSIVPGVGTVLGGMAGGGIGSAVNEFIDPMGAKDEGEGVNYLSMALDTLLPGVGKAISSVAKGIPSMAGGLQQGFQKVFGANAEKLVANGGAMTLDAAKSMMNTVIQKASGSTFVDSAPIRAAVAELEKLGELSSIPAATRQRLLNFIDGTAGFPSLKVAQDPLNNGVRTAPGHNIWVPFENFHATMTDLGKIVSKAEKEGGRLSDAATRLYGAFSDALESTARASGQGTALQEVVTAMKQYKQSIGGSILQEMADKSITYSGRAVRGFDVNGFITRVEQNAEMLKKYIPEGELSDLVRRFRKEWVPSVNGASSIEPAVAGGAAAVVSGAGSNFLLGWLGAKTAGIMMASKAGRDAISAMYRLGNTAGVATGMAGQVAVESPIGRQMTRGGQKAAIGLGRSLSGFGAEPQGPLQ